MPMLPRWEQLHGDSSHLRLLPAAGSGRRLHYVDARHGGSAQEGMELNRINGGLFIITVPITSAGSCKTWWSGVPFIVMFECKDTRIIGYCEMCHTYKGSTCILLGH